MDFLDKVAHKLFEDHQNEMEHQLVVLPSRRSGLYLSRFLSRLSDKPQWAPQMVTVSDLFQSFTTLKKASDETLIFELYNIYKTMVSEPMTFDDFWSWGEIIIADFNDIDLYLADAQKLYNNISDLKEIDEKFGSLTENQIEIIRKFWVSFDPAVKSSVARNRFRSVWMLLGPLYDSFASHLRNTGYCSEGMLCRDVAVRAENGTLVSSEKATYHIVGLNALNECEKILFRFLRAEGKAKFYWDKDHVFMRDPDHKASRFINENLNIFPDALNNGPGFPEPRSNGRWAIIDTPSDTSQAKMLPQILDEVFKAGPDDLTDTAVVLADEKLLMPVLTSLPSAVEDVNVTMGHPFRVTPLYSFIRQLYIIARSARRNASAITFRTEDIIVLLRHQYFRILAGDSGESLAGELISANRIRVGTDELEGKLPPLRLFDIPEDGSDYPAYLINALGDIEERTYQPDTETGGMSVDREYLRLALAEIGKLRNLIDANNLSLKIDTCIRLIDRILKKLIVPFSGEPLKGLQVMGVLETRALEFKNIVFLSMNEGVFPHQSYENTFIPYNIRRAFGLPTINEHESIYSYHFFRLLRKPSLGWFLYNSTSQGLNTGEMSRYLIQMKYDPKYNPDVSALNISVGHSKTMPERLKKTTGHIKFLKDKYNAGNPKLEFLSPSAINTWMNCRMKFYFMYVCGLPEEEKLEKEIDQRRFGNILHNTMQKLYMPYAGKEDVVEMIDALAGNAAILRRVIIETASEEMKWSEENLLAGKGVIIIDVLERYIKDILKYDRNHEPLVLIDLERKFHRIFEVETETGRFMINIGGRVDRVDRTGNMIRVVDYKTGSPKKEIDSVDDLFDETKEKRNDAVMQTLLYSGIVSESYPGEVIMPAIYWIQRISSPDFDPLQNIREFKDRATDLRYWSEVMHGFNEKLGSSLKEMFSADGDFVMTDFENRCTWCPFRRLCRR